MVKMRNVFPGQPNVGEKMIVHFHQTSGLRATTVVPDQISPHPPHEPADRAGQGGDVEPNARLTRRNLYSRVHGVAPASE